MADEIVTVSLREIADRFGIGIEGARAKAKRRAAKGTWRILPQNHPADPLRIELPAAEWVMGTSQGAPNSPNASPSTPAALREPQREEAHDIKALVALVERMTQASASTAERLIVAERERGEAELRAAVAVAGREAAERNVADLAERLVAADRRQIEMQGNHAAELRTIQERAAGETARVQSELDAWRTRPWWKRLTG